MTKNEGAEPVNAETREQLLELVAKAKDAFGRELRTIKAPDIQVRRETRDGEESATLYGHAAVFDQETIIGGYFREKIAPGAFKKTIKEADVRHLFNHDPNLVLASPQGPSRNASRSQMDHNMVAQRSERSSRRACYVDSSPLGSHAPRGHNLRLGPQPPAQEPEASRLAASNGRQA